jgi:hypothetical protein
VAPFDWCEREEAGCIRSQNFLPSHLTGESTRVAAHVARTRRAVDGVSSDPVFGHELRV